jgi:hypothetical protein
MNNLTELKKAMGQISKRVQREGKLDPKNAELNDSIYKLFAQPHCQYMMGEGNERINVTRRALFRAERLMRREGFAWKIVDWETLKTWLYDNWDKILRVMLSLALMFLL